MGTETLSPAQVETPAGVELVEILRQVSEDGTLTTQEIGRLHHWLDENRFVGFEGAERLLEAVEVIAADGLVEHHERQELMELIKRVLPEPVQSGEALVGSCDGSPHRVLPRGRARLGATPLAVVDLETTGLYFKSVDRIVEVAVVRYRPDGSVEDEFETLVNPHRDVGPTEIHRINASDLVGAPDFEEVAGDLADRLGGAVLVGHNLRFDLSFLQAEYERLGVPWPAMPTLCTQRLARQFLSELPRRGLQACCEAMGISLEDHHCALADARATGALVTALLRQARQDGVQDLGELDCGTIDYPGIPWMAGRRGGRRQTRRQAHLRREESRAFLPRLVARLPGATSTGGAIDEYLALLDRVLEDRKVEPDEGRRLVEVATQWGLARADVERAHRVYMDGLIQAAWSDGVVTEAEAADLLGVGEMLGLNLAEVRGAVSWRPALVSGCAAKRNELAGQRVCFTGELAGTFRGEPLTRAVAERVASEVGMIIQAGVTKRLDILVAADADSESGKARKAREYGKRVMAGPAFFAAVAVALDAG